jgi:hypothetical protein
MVSTPYFDVFHLNHSPDSEGFLDFLIPPSRCKDNAINYATIASFHIFLKFIIHTSSSYFMLMLHNLGSLLYLIKWTKDKSVTQYMT